MERAAQASKTRKTFPDWLREGLFIIASIALAFGVEEFRQRRENNQLVTRVLSSVEAEWPHNIAEIEPFLDIHRRWAAALEQAAPVKWAVSLSAISDRLSALAPKAESRRLKAAPSYRRPLQGITTEVKYAPSGHVVFLRDGALMAQRFDVDRLELQDVPFVVLDRFTAADAVAGPFSISATGTLAFRSAFVRPDSQLVWLDRSGKPLGVASPPGRYADIELSRDDRFVVFEAAPPTITPSVSAGGTLQRRHLGARPRDRRHQPRHL